eukprot:TRINITY_DN32914_c0_g1_i1.p1 TRINITY_DN32914_c0_g1~~TRINITY_DN32914_c0_g1_i1.p1  ORF type:complete len:709 (-),score=137.80 TRINITY_DN32914_c0_g1_i1:491-2344(-)
MDNDLYIWSDDLVSKYWVGDDPWGDFKQIQAMCGPDDPVGAAEQRCPWQGGPTCLYGVMTAMACMATMFAFHGAKMPEFAVAAAWRAGQQLRNLLRSGERVMEFLDSSSWPVRINEVIVLEQAYADLAARAKQDAQNGHNITRSDELPMPRLLDSPWIETTASAKRATAAADSSMRRIAASRWPQRFSLVAGLDMAAAMAADVAAVAAAASARALLQSGPRLVRIWSYGTHCAVMAEPILVIARLLAEDIRLEVTWRGTKDYCKFSTGEFAPSEDTGSPFAALLERHDPKKTRLEGQTVKSPNDAAALQDAPGFHRGLLQALAQDQSFAAADVAFCSEPAFACAAMHEAGKPVMGYFGVHIGFMLQKEEDQLRFYETFTKNLAADPRSTLATKSPYLSQQLLRHVAVQVPALRPASLYTQPATYTASRPQEVVVNRRPVSFWNVSALLTAYSASTESPLTFTNVDELRQRGRASYKDFGACLAGVFYPYDWLQTMMLYDWANIALPVFVPDSPMYTFAVGTNTPDAWPAVSWEPPADLYPYHYGDWANAEGRAYWWQLSDFKSMKGIATFTSVAHLLAQLSSRDYLWELSGQLRMGHLQRATAAAAFWKQGLLRAVS